MMALCFWNSFTAPWEPSLMGIVFVLVHCPRKIIFYAHNCAILWKLSKPYNSALRINRSLNFSVPRYFSRRAGHHKVFMMSSHQTPDRFKVQTDFSMGICKTFRGQLSLTTTSELRHRLVITAVLRGHVCTVVILFVYKQ